MDLGLAGKKAIITGGSRGIGLYTAKLLASEGCDIVFCARRPEDITSAADSINTGDGGSAWGFQADLEDETATRQFARDALEALGGADIVIHNASGFDMAGDEAGWMRSFQVDMGKRCFTGRCLVRGRFLGSAQAGEP